MGLTDFAVVGHDSGGMIARYAFAGDERVRAWGLIDTEQPPKPHWRFSSFLAIRNVPRFEALVARVFGMPRLRRLKLLGGDLFHDRSRLDGEFDEFFLRPLRDEPDRQWAAGQFGRNFDMGKFAGLTELHGKIDEPVRLVWGEKDPFFPVDRTRAMLPEFGGEVSLEVIPKAKLFSHEEFPEPAARALLRTIS